MSKSYVYEDKTFSKKYTSLVITTGDKHNPYHYVLNLIYNITRSHIISQKNNIILTYFPTDNVTVIDILLKKLFTGKIEV